MSISSRHNFRRYFIALTVIVALAGLVLWGPGLLERAKLRNSQSTASEQDEHGHSHSHGGHDSATEISLSPQALRNIGYEPLKVALTDYEKTISLPGMVVERPGKSQIQISAPLGGTITKIDVIPGEAIDPDRPLFDIRLTHEELVSAQGEFLKTVQDLDVVNREIARLESLTDGIVPGKRILDQKYERQKLEGRMKAQTESLLLHGLSEAQVDEIKKTGQLLKSLTVRSPGPKDDADCTGNHLYHVQKLDVQLGQQVDAGAPLGVIADHCELYIEGTAFEEDAERLREAAATGASVSVDLIARNQREPAISGLKLMYLADQVDPQSRTFHFYIKLPNKIVLDRREGAHRFLQWQFKPGQRVEVSVPVERWEKRIVVPADAIVTDGPETLVYQQTGKHFHRVPVHVEFRDQKTAVIANDGAVFPGDTIAGRGAFQIHLALKNKSGGTIDPHAGHNH